jgi:beta-carotene 3-hydroxylase
MVFGITELGFNFKFFIGLGILFYGIAYFLVHDVLIHQRFKWFKNTKNKYLRGLRKAHKVHHKNMGKQEGKCFGMLFVPKKYFTM